MTTMTQWNHNQPVKGSYCGYAFTGTITDSRWTPDRRNIIFSIALDRPISVFGQERTAIEIWSNSDMDAVDKA